MKVSYFWLAAALFLMIGCPWLAVRFAGNSGMAICFLLFFAADPLFSAFCGAYAGKSIRDRWYWPLVPAALFLAGTWIFFSREEPAFLMYSGIYLLIGVVVMLVSAIAAKRK